MRSRRPAALERLEKRVLFSATDYVVDSTGSGSSGVGNSGTLAYVVGLANANPNVDGSAITFSPLFNSPRTIILAATLPLTETAGPLMIEGPGANHLTLSGIGSIGVFKADQKVPIDITGVVSGSFNLVGTGGAGGLTESDGNQVDVANPMLGTLVDQGGPTQTIALLPGSPAIGMGSGSIPNVSVPTVDRRGVHRPINSIDLCAFQVRASC